MQMICALLVFQTSEFPDLLVEISPWLDWLGAPRDDVVARLGAQFARPFRGIPVHLTHGRELIVVKEVADTMESAFSAVST